MDIEKLIHCLQCCARVDAHNIGCDDCGLEYCGPECQQLCGTAATALSTLQAENEKLRADVVRFNDLLASYQAERDAAVESIPHECKTCIYYTVSFNGCTPDHDCTNPDGGCSNNYDRWQWRGIKKED